ncbi:MAG: YkgJ family cysteine cluster protein [Bacteriovoracaceae bacterium]|nr:YkgJ family cysteine cluster protein [Bacteriovoracaceae bacterium]
MDIQYSTTGYRHLLETSDDERCELMISATNRFIALYNKSGGGIKSARFFNEMIDDFISKQLREDPNAVKNLACKEGCSNCCSQAVGVTEDEAQSVLSYAYESRVSINLDRLKRQKFVGMENWTTLSKEDRVCIFLDESRGNCLVHKHRPNACRNHMALGSGEFCGPNTDGNSQSYSVLLSDICTTAAFNCSPTGIFADFIYS